MQAALGLALLVALSAPASAQEQESSATAEIFRRFADRVVKIEVVETGSGAKATVGSGFVATAAGHLITNYHVISQVVLRPERYRVQWYDAGGRVRPGRVVAVDVVRDLAVVTTDAPTDRFFTLAPVPLPQGTRLYSLGHPHDLGLTIVEGTYNGLLEYSLYPKIHFTGPINPGMSGGPALAPSGKVVGVNVSTAGEEVSFLVPIEPAIALLSRAVAVPPPAPKTLLADVGAQLLENQEAYLAPLFKTTDSAVRLGPFLVPTQPARFFRCWGDADRRAQQLYEAVQHQCSTDDYIFLSGEESSGIVTLEHRVVSSTKLNPLRFYALYQRQFQNATGGMAAGDEEMTAYRCQTRNVGRPGIVIRAIVCFRRYRKFAGLYDAVVKAAVLGARDTGLITSLTLSGVSFPNAERLAKSFLERIRWARR
ncbi:MAG: serine protease [Gemmatimonadota bacterium]